jgi:hypothetical protein
VAGKVKSVVIRGKGEGLPCLDVPCDVVGAEEKVSAKEAERAEAAGEAPSRFYYQLILAPREASSPRVYAFCEESQAIEASDAIRQAQAAVPAVVDLTLSRGGTVSVDALKLEG